MDTAANYLLKAGYALDDARHVRLYVHADESRHAGMMIEGDDCRGILAMILADVNMTIDLYEWLVQRYDPDLVRMQDNVRKVVFELVESQRDRCRGYHGSATENGSVWDWSLR